MDKKFNFFYKHRSNIDNFLILIIVSIFLEMVLYHYASQNLVENVAISLGNIAGQGAEIVESNIDAKLEVLELLSTLPTIKDRQLPAEEKLRFLEMDFNSGEFRRISIADVNGNSITTDGEVLYIGDREYFRKALAGERNVSDPIISRIDQDYVLAYAVPIYDNGVITGVLYATHDAEELFKSVEYGHIAEYENSFIINREGMIIAHKDRDLVNSSFNILTEAERNPELASMGKIAQKMLNSENGTGEFKFEGVSYYAGFSPIQGTGWAIAASAPKKSVFKQVNPALFLILLMATALFLVLTGTGVYSGKLLKRLKREHNMFNTAVDVANIIAFRLDSNYIILDLNKYAEELTGYSRSELVSGKNFRDLLEDGKKPDYFNLPDGKKQNKMLENVELSLVKKDGRILNAIWSIKTCDEQDEIAVEILGVDITERVQYEKQLLENHEELSKVYEELAASDGQLKQRFTELSLMQQQLIESEERFRIASEGSNAVIWDFDMIAMRYYFSDRWYELLSYEKGELDEANGGWKNIIHPDDAAEADKARADHLEGRTELYSSEYRMRSKDGGYIWFDVRGKAMRDGNGTVIRFAGSLIDITQRKKYETKMLESYQELEATYEELTATEEELKQQVDEIQANHEKIKESEEKYSYLARHDILTGLPNKFSLLEETQKNSLSPADSVQALMFLDMDNFKYINDTMGHLFGDQLIVMVSGRLSSLLKENCSLYRLSGDEFVIIVRGLKRHQDAETLASDILKGFMEKVTIHSNMLYVSLSIGIALYPQHGKNVEELINCADIAMYKAKEIGRNRYVVYSPEMKHAFTERADLERCMHMAFERNEFEIYFQPQLDLRLNKVTVLEALLRWKSPELGFVSPLKFIKVAEDTHQITRIGDWILRNSCAFLKKLHTKGYSDLSVSVNISILQLLQTDFTDKVMDTLELLDLEPQYLELEITESVLMESFETIGSKLEQLRQRGIKVALDDFGKGYSSLSYLKQLPISTLKIDKSFIDYIIPDRTSRTLTGHIVMLGKSLGMSIVAEGVETQEQFDYLKRQKCHRIQGFLFCKPIPQKDIEAFLEHTSRGHSQ